MIFENEIFNISQIYNVVRWAPRSSMRYAYPGKLPTYELMCFYEGDVLLHFSKKKLHVTAGDILYLPKGLENNQYVVSVNEPFSLFNIYFDTSEHLPDEAKIFRPHAENKIFQDYYEKIYRTWIGKRSGYYYKSMQQAYNIFDLLRRMQSSYLNNKYNDIFSAPDEYMSKHYCDVHFNFTELIKLSGLSYSYFKKLFIIKYGCPPVKHITKLKINRACELLRTGKFNITEVSHLCGFENVYYFSNVFKKLIGVSPKNYVDNKKI